MPLGISFFEDVPWWSLCTYSHGGWGCRRRFRSLLLCPLSEERYYFPLFGDYTNKVLYFVFALNLISSGRSPVGSLFASEEQKKVES